MIKFHLKNKGINIGKQTRVSYFDRINETELTPKNGKVMSFDNSDDRNAKNERSHHRSSHRSNAKQLSIDVDDAESNLNKSDIRNNLTPNNRSKSGLMEANMNNNAYFKSYRTKMVSPNHNAKKFFDASKSPLRPRDRDQNYRSNGDKSSTPLGKNNAECFKSPNSSIRDVL